MSDERKFWLDDPLNVKKLIRVFFGICAVLLSLDFFFHRHLSFENSTAEFPLEGYFGFYAFYGFVACVLLVLVAKYVLRKIVMRPEDYYDG